MHIISHRGAKAYGDENSLKTIKIAAGLDVEFIEFDIQCTRNNIIVVQHDTKTPKGLIIHEHTYKTLQREISYMPTLREALKECGDKPALIESKAAGTIAKSLETIRHYPASVIASKIPEEILSARINLPSHKTYFIKGTTPFNIIKIAKQIDASGIGLNKNWLLLLPYYYLQAKKNKLDIFCYTIDSVFVAKLVARLLKDIYIVTNKPKHLLDNKHAE